ncbi:MtrB/PioB family outer membrane beta-barrel protein [Dissulfurirhabdus thermomarina]|uniref:MtrB/PioB family outer membrane beta-barrel protein n=3 Tax=Dissulfurirhabdus thermomarina TaxID=1765737 RepID=A0A6N9TS41_DISTH|nr:MtrB/PioB family outer membrane beta-barrel protein [Dissulfurirhabdus thermomarina]NMX23422.1 MtrB/PioB family outer membrane beta-barrel protein [Dissulfurirhabdus thermomarina]
MKRIAGIGLLAALALALVSASPARSEEGKALEGRVSVGGAWTLDDVDEDESAAKGAAEYNSILEKNLTVDLAGDVSLRTGLVDLDADAHYQDGDDQEYGGALSLARILTVKTTYNRFLHQLGHDELDNLEAHIFSNTVAGPVAGTPFTAPVAPSTVGSAAVYHTDFNPTDEYAITRSEMRNSAVIHVPALPMLTVGFDHRYEKREGMEQARTMSKCSACHVVGVSKEVHELTNEYTPKVSLRMGTFALEYSYMHREFEDKSDELSLTYNALAAPTHFGLFTNRLQFDNAEGALPFARTPDSTKDVHTAKARWDIDPHNTLTAAVVYSTSTNNEADGAYDALRGEFDKELELESTAVMARWHSRLSRALSLTVHGKYQTMDNSDVFVDVNDRPNPGTIPLGGSTTLSQGYGLGAGYWDHVRESGNDLDITTAGFDVVWRALPRFTVRGGYEYQLEERDNHEAVPGETTEHTFKVSGDWRATRTLRLRLGYRFELVDDAYGLKRASCTPDNSFGAYGGPNPDLYDYSRSYRPTIYEARTAFRSNQANSAHEVNLRAGWTPVNNLTAALHAKYRYAQNDDVDGNDWKQNLFTGGVDLTYAPSEKVVFNVGYTYFYDQYDSMYCIAVYDG